MDYRDTVTGQSIGDGYYQSTAQWFDTVTYGDSNPDWKQALREGRDATTSLTGSKCTVRVKSANLKFVKKIPNPAFYILMKGAHHFSVQPPAANPATLDETSANAFALGKFAQKVNEAEIAIQGGVVLGELRQTLQMLRSPAQGLRRLVDDQRGILVRIRAQRRLGSILLHKRKIAENLADAWLEMQLGWRPFLSDIESAHNALNIYTTGQSAYTRRITAKAEDNTIGIESVSNNGESFAFVQVHTRTDSHISVIYRGALRVEGQHPGSMDPKLLGFRPKDFLPTAWELIPYSFLADYFTNIGGIIYGMSNLFTRLAWCNRTVRKSYEGHGWSSKYLDDSVTVTGAFAEIVTSKTSVSRAKYTGHGVPSLAFKIPSFGSLKWLNIAALVANRKGDRNWSFD
jgi:hypothetical protein